jgi:hypothetical protein
VIVKAEGGVASDTDARALGLPRRLLQRRYGKLGARAQLQQAIEIQMGFNPLRELTKTILRQRLVRKMEAQMSFGNRETCVARKISK